MSPLCKHFCFVRDNNISNFNIVSLTMSGLIPYKKRFCRLFRYCLTLKCMIFYFGSKKLYLILRKVHNTGKIMKIIENNFFV